MVKSVSAKAKAKATATAKCFPKQQGTQPDKAKRMLKRRSSLAMLNALAAELCLGVVPLLLKETRGKVVTARVCMLERRCQNDGLAKRLRDAVEQFVNNGGKLLRDVVPVAQAQSALQGSSGAAAGTELCANNLDTNESTVSAVVPLHRVLEGSFQLQSKAFMLTYNSRHFSADCWKRFESHVCSLHNSLKARGWAATLEESLHTADGQQRYHLHAYFYWDDGVGLYSRNTDKLVFENVRPRVDVNTATAPKLFYLASCHGLWYVSVLKLGTKHSATNFRPWREYVPRAAWLQDLYGAKKLSHDQYLRLSASFRIGHSSRRRDALDVARDERETSVQTHIAQELDLLVKAGLFKKSKQFEVVDRFVAYFTGAPLFRRPILAIVGGTNLGKSILAADVLNSISVALGLDGFLEITVEGDDVLDLGEFDHSKQGGVLFDGVGDVMFLKRNREVLQGRPKKCKGGKSATMMYSYPFTLCRRAVVVTFDLSAKNLALLQTDHWLSDSRNVLQLRLSEPAWVCTIVRASPALSPRTPQQTMQSWTVDALADFLCGQDLYGPAASLQKAGVNGCDFLAWTSATGIVTDVHVSPFTAKKLLACRARYLGA